MPSAAARDLCACHRNNSHIGRRRVPVSACFSVIFLSLAKTKPQEPQNRWPAPPDPRHSAELGVFGVVLSASPAARA